MDEKKVTRRIGYGEKEKPHCEGLNAILILSFDLALVTWRALVGHGLFFIISCYYDMVHRGNKLQQKQRANCKEIKHDPSRGV